MPIIYSFIALAISFAPSAYAQGYIETLKVENLTLPTQTASRVPYLDANKKLVTSAITATELGYLTGITSNVQTQLNAKQASGNYITALTGDVTASGPGSASATLKPIVNSQISTSAGIGVTKLEALTASRVMITNGAGFASASSVTSTTLGFLDVSSSLTTLLAAKAPTASPTFTGSVNIGTTTAGVVISSSGGALSIQAPVSIANGGTNNASLAVTAGGVVYTDGSKFGNVGVGTTGQLLQSNGSGAPSWTTFSASGKAAGEVFMTAATSCPSGSIHADGSSVLRTGGTECGGGSCANLFSAISTTYGAVDGSHFTLPDTRGVFIRGQGTQTISAINYTGTQGTTQSDLMQGHRHINRVPAAAGGSSVWGFTFWSGSRSTTLSDSAAAGEDAIGAPVNDGTNGNPRTGSETRPANIALKYCIVY